MIKRIVIIGDGFSLKVISKKLNIPYFKVEQYHSGITEISKDYIRVNGQIVLYDYLIIGDYMPETHNLLRDKINEIDLVGHKIFPNTNFRLNRPLENIFYINQHQGYFPNIPNRPFKPYFEWKLGKYISKQILKNGNFPGSIYTLRKLAINGYFVVLDKIAKIVEKLWYNDV